MFRKETEKFSTFFHAMERAKIIHSGGGAKLSKNYYPNDDD